MVRDRRLTDLGVVAEGVGNTIAFLLALAIDAALPIDAALQISSHTIFIDAARAFFDTPSATFMLFLAFEVTPSLLLQTPSMHTLVCKHCAICSDRVPIRQLMPLPSTSYITTDEPKHKFEIDSTT